MVATSANGVLRALPLTKSFCYIDFLVEASLESFQVSVFSFLVLDASSEVARG